MSIHSAGRDPEALVVKPAQACRLLSCGKTHLYELLAAKKLDSFFDGGSRKITVSSIHAYIANQLATAGAS